MPNANRPNGFTPRRHIAGGLVRHSEGIYKIQAAYNTNLFRGDAVILTSGYVLKGLENSANILGVFAGCRYRDADGKTQFRSYWPASTATLGSEDVEAFIYTDPHITYLVQTSVGTAYVDATHKGGVFDLISTTAGSAFTGQSGMELNLGDTGTGQWRVLGLIDTPDNAAGLNAKVEVVNHVPLMA
jgi:hypothetical protein